MRKVSEMDSEARDAWSQYVIEWSKPDRHGWRCMRAADRVEQAFRKYELEQAFDSASKPYLEQAIEQTQQFAAQQQESRRQEIQNMLDSGNENELGFLSNDN